MNPIETVDIECPYCGEITALVVDCSVTDQDLIEDCPVCCRPIALLIRVGASGIDVVPRREDEA